MILNTFFKACLFSLAIVLAYACSDNGQEHMEDVECTYLHISHTRMYDNSSIDKEAEQVDYTYYDKLLLGGDMMNISSESEETLDYLNDLFEIAEPSTMWSLGNHDRTDVGLIENYTGRNNFYSYTDKGITYLVLDTQQDTSRIVGDQLQLVKSVLDTIAHSSHLVILTHHLVWMDDGGPLAEIADSISNAPLSDCWYCINPNNFYADIYPRLVEVQSKGVQVLCIAGDIGNHVNSFEEQTADGVYFLASGIFYDRPTNKGLVMQHNVTQQTLTWEFVPVADLGE